MASRKKTVTEVPKPTNAEQAAPAVSVPPPAPAPGLAHADEVDQTRKLGIGNVPEAQTTAPAPAEPEPVVQNANDVIHSAPELVHAGQALDVGGAPLDPQPEKGLPPDPSFQDRTARAAYEVVRAFHVGKGLADRGAWADQNTDTQRAVRDRVDRAQRGEQSADSRAHGSFEDALVRALVEALKD